MGRSLNRSAGVVRSVQRFGRSDHPVCAFASLGASTPPLRGGEGGMSKYVQFHGARAKLRPSLTPCVSKTRRKSMKRLCAVVLFCIIAAPRVFGDAQDTV